MSLENEPFKAPFIVWVDYGYDGWSPKGYETMEEAQRAIADCVYSGPCVVTGPVLFPPKAPENQETPK